MDRHIHIVAARHKTSGLMITYDKDQRRLVTQARNMRERGLKRIIYSLAVGLTYVVTVLLKLTRRWPAGCHLIENCAVSDLVPSHHVRDRDPWRMGGNKRDLQEFRTRVIGQ